MHYCDSLVSKWVIIIFYEWVWLKYGQFFFFKQKTAYEIVDCDWSSDVCSSDLPNIADLGILWLKDSSLHRAAIATLSTRTPEVIWAAPKSPEAKIDSLISENWSEDCQPSVRTEASKPYRQSQFNQAPPDCGNLES